MKQFFLLVVQQLLGLVRYRVVHLVVVVLDLPQIMDGVLVVRLKLKTCIHMELIILNLHLEPPGGGGAILDAGPDGWLGIIFFIIAIVLLSVRNFCPATEEMIVWIKARSPLARNGGDATR